MNRIVLPAHLVADFARLVTTLLPKPATRDVKALETFAAMASAMIKKGVSPQNLVPFTDAIQDKIKDAGVGTAKWAVRFADHLEDATDGESDEPAVAPHIGAIIASDGSDGPFRPLLGGHIDEQ